MVENFANKSKDHSFDNWTSIDILNNYTKAFFGKNLEPKDYGYDYDGLSVKNDSFINNLMETEWYADWGRGVTASDIQSLYNYAIVRIDVLNYGYMYSKYILVERKNVDQELISYIDSILKENDYTKEIGLLNERQVELLNVFNNFRENKLSYNLNGAVEFNNDFYESHKVDREDVISLKNYLSNLDIKDLNYYKPVVYIKMKPNEVGRYIFSFKDELEDDVVYNFCLDGLDVNVILTKDDINKLKEKNTVFAVEKFDNNVFITPLSKKRTTLPINLSIIFNEVTEEKYISKVPTLYYLMNSDQKFSIVYTNHYGPIKFENYDSPNLEDLGLDGFKSIAFKNILSSKVLSEASDSLDLEQPLNKGELARAVGFLLGDYDDDKDIKLDDVNELDKIYIKSAIKHKIFNHEGSSFYPNEKVKRAQLINVLTEVLKLNGFDIEDDDLSEAKSFSDFDNFKSIEKNVELALECGIIADEGEDFDADEIVNRDEAILLLYRTLAFISKKTVIENTHLEDFEAEKNLLSTVTNRLREPKIEEMNNLNSFIFIESESFLDKLEDLFENKIILILTILIVIIIIAIIIFLILKKKKNKKAIKDDKSKNVIKEKFIEEDDDDEEATEEESYIEEDIIDDNVEIKFCPNCGAEYNGEKFCSKCGYDLRKNK